jgi:hypothetical protein
MEEAPTQQSTLDVVADIAEFANSVASLLVGHRKILVEGGFDSAMADHMCFGLHSKLLGLVDENPGFFDGYELLEEYDLGDEDEG